MNTEFPVWPEQGSQYASGVDHLFIFLLAVAGVFTAIICISILYFIVKYRHSSRASRDNPRQKNTRLEIVWSVVPLLLTMVMFGWGAKLYSDAHEPPPGTVKVNVLAKQWMWKLQHEEGNAEINELHVPVGQPVVLRMISEDVIHSFYVPAFRIKMDVLPGRYTYTWFRPSRAGEYRLFCAEYCGTGHSRMVGRVVVMEPADYSEWLSGAPQESSAVAGKRLFESFRCNACHQNKETARCPPLDGLYGKMVPLQNGTTVTADENYLRESILVPGAKVVAGYRPVMPTFKGQIGEGEILQIIAYLKSLAPENESATSNDANPGNAPRK